MTTARRWMQARPQSEIRRAFAVRLVLETLAFLLAISVVVAAVYVVPAT